MKKIAVGLAAAVIGATSFAGAANADVVVKYRGGWHHHHHHHPRAVVVRPAPRVWVGPRRVVIRDGCVTKKKINRWGEVVKKTWC